MKATGKEIINAVPGNSLLAFAITKLYMEGRNREEIGTMCELMAWDVYKSIDFKSLPQAIKATEPHSNVVAEAEGGIKK